VVFDQWSWDEDTPPEMIKDLRNIKLEELGI